MAFNDYETSADRGAPVELYQFFYGVEADGTTPRFYAYTDGEAEVVYDGVTYTPLAGLRRSEIGVQGRADKDEVTVTVPRTSEVASLFVAFPPTQVVAVHIRQGHVPNPDDPGSWASGENFPVIWTGRVLEAAPQGATAKLTCDSSTSTMRTLGLRRNYQWPCPLALYGSRCGADKAAATTTATVAAVSGNRVTLASGWQKQVDDGSSGTEDVGAGNYIGGLVEWAGADGPERRTVLSVSGDQLVLSGPARGLENADQVSVVLGCPHTLAACETLHDNVQNFGGQPFIPTENPVGKNNHT